MGILSCSPPGEQAGLRAPDEGASGLAKLLLDGLQRRGRILEVDTVYACGDQPGQEHAHIAVGHAVWGSGFIPSVGSLAP